MGSHVHGLIELFVCLAKDNESRQRMLDDANNNNQQNTPVANVLQSGTTDTSGSSKEPKKTKKVSYCLLNIKLTYLSSSNFRVTNGINKNRKEQRS